MFVLKKRLDLSKYSEDWKGCYLDLRELNISDVEERMKKIQDLEEGSVEQINIMKELIADCFLGGKGFDGEKIVEIKKEDVSQLPISIYKEAFGFLAGTSEIEKS